MYKRVNASDHENPTRVKWELVVRFNSYPTDLNLQSQANYILSPDFTQYLDVDRKNKKFMIRDTFTQEIKYHIPEWLMNSKSESY